MDRGTRVPWCLRGRWDGFVIALGDLREAFPLLDDVSDGHLRLPMEREQLCTSPDILKHMMEPYPWVSLLMQ